MKVNKSYFVRETDWSKSVGFKKRSQNFEFEENFKFGFSEWYSKETFKELPGGLSEYTEEC